MPCSPPRSSTPTPMRRHCWRRTPSSRSSRRTPRRPAWTWRPATSRWPVGSWRCSPSGSTDEQRIDDALAELGELAKTSRGQHHQTPQRLGLDPAAEGGDRRAAEPGLRASRLSREPSDRRGSRRPRSLRQGQGQRGQPRAARGQLRPSRPRLGQATTPATTPTRWEPGPPTPRRTSPPCRPHDFRSNEKSVVPRRRHAAHRARGRRRHRDGAEGVGAGARPARSSTPR